ncbi:MAG: hypothetical protein FWF05_03425 [Oscillospiraceae bacterium]|nr:hypothetical protein [Oscillospiraceae bacterium]
MLPLALHLDQMSKTVPAMRYRGDIPFEQWQAAAREKLRDLLGMDTFQLCDPDFEQQAAEDMGAYLRTKFSFQSEEGYRVPGWWLRPKALTGSGVVICLQGHTTGMHISLGEAMYPEDSETLDGDRDFAVQTVGRGMCALVIEQRNFGERGREDDGCYRPATTALLMGRTTIGERVWDVMRAIDAARANLVQELPGEAEFYCMGNSGGGTATYYASCLETRIVKSMPSCAVCDFDESIAPIRHCICNYVPGIRKWFEMGDMGGMIAPRPLLIVAGQEDRIFPIDGTLATFERIKSLYDAAGASDKCVLHIGAEGHKFYREAWEAFEELPRG